MQSTGLRDRHGKEIFEGDIVRGIDGACVQVIWDNGSFVLSGVMLFLTGLRTPAAPGPATPATAANQPRSRPVPHRAPRR